jgi:hypothetical protein
VAVNPQMLPHARGFAFAGLVASNRLIRVYLGHTKNQQTVRFTATAYIFQEDVAVQLRQKKP